MRSHLGAKSTVERSSSLTAGIGFIQAGPWANAGYPFFIHPVQVSMRNIGTFGFSYAVLTEIGTDANERNVVSCSRSATPLDSRVEKRSSRPLNVALASSRA